MSEFVLSGLSGDQLLDHVAAMGLVWILRDHGAKLHYDDHTPVLTVDGDITARDVAHMVTERSLEWNHYREDPRDENIDWPAPMMNDRVGPGDVVDYWQTHWDDDGCVMLLKPETLASKSKTKKDANGDNVVITEVSFNNSSLWTTAGNYSWISVVVPKVAQKLRSRTVDSNSLFKHYEDGIESLLNGSVPRLSDRPAILGYSLTTTHITDRFAGSGFFCEDLELIASVVVHRLSPRGRLNSSRGDTWFMWHLNTAPMSWDGLVAITRRNVISGLVGYRTSMYKANSYYEFHPTEQIVARKKAVR